MTEDGYTWVPFMYDPDKEVFTANLPAGAVFSHIVYRAPSGQLMLGYKPLPETPKDDQ